MGRTGSRRRGHGVAGGGSSLDPLTGGVQRLGGAPAERLRRPAVAGDDVRVEGDRVGLEHAGDVELLRRAVRRSSAVWPSLRRRARLRWGRWRPVELQRVVDELAARAWRRAGVGRYGPGGSHGCLLWVRGGGAVPWRDGRHRPANTTGLVGCHLLVVAALGRRVVIVL